MEVTTEEAKKIVADMYGMKPEDLEEKPTDVAINDLDKRYYKKKIKIKGMITRISDVVNENYEFIYTCPKCGDVYSSQSKKPDRCSRCNRDYQLEKTNNRDVQEIEIEETLEVFDRLPGRVRVRFYDELIYDPIIKRLQAGHSVDVVGILKKEKTKSTGGREMFFYYVEANNINPLDAHFDEINISEEDKKEIIEFSKDNPLDKLASRVAPTIVGLDQVKKALVLQMVRGPENYPNNRPRINLLLAGDPGTAKSRLVLEAHKRTPRSIYGSGDNMSRAGLASTTERDELTGKWTLRAGILCRANKSVIAIDEIDKLSDQDKDALHTPMSLGKVFTTKAGNNTEMVADCSVLACCNPKHGSFDLTGMETIFSQIRLPQPIMDRFDLVFIFIDRIDKDNDLKIINSFLDEPEAEDDIEFFKKYISYAMEIKPIPSNEVKEAISELYVDLRGKASMLGNKKSGRISSRQAGALIRLAVASAKVRLSNVVELEDLHTAEKLMLDSLESMGFARDLSEMDQAMIYGGTTRKKLDKLHNLTNHIKTFLESEGTHSEDDLIQYLIGVGINDEKFFSTHLERLKSEGTIAGRYNDLRWQDF